MGKKRLDVQNRGFEFQELLSDNLDIVCLGPEEPFRATGD